MNRFPTIVAAAIVAAGVTVGGSAAQSSPAPAAKTATPQHVSAQSPVLTCGPTSTSGIWGCWNNIVGQYTLTFPSTMWCPTEDSCDYNYNGALDRADLRHV